MSTSSTALTGVLERIAAAARRSGRRAEEVVLVGASKLQPLERMLAVYREGLRVFGENRVQEAEDKVGRFPPDVSWHLLGPLQSNKARRAVELFDVIHSLDRLKIADALDRHADALGRRLDVFLEVNLADETSKHGFAPAAVEQAIASVLEQHSSLRVIGLMAIPPVGDAESARPWFCRLRELRDQLRDRHGERFGGMLSMGMSGDFEVAVEEGATHVRVGTALFGERG